VNEDDERVKKGEGNMELAELVVLVAGVVAEETGRRE